MVARRGGKGWTHRLGRFMVAEGALVILGNGCEAPTPRNAHKADQPARGTR
ncbi:unnamed protein product [Ixodes hexagonus]